MENDGWFYVAMVGIAVAWVFGLWVGHNAGYADMAREAYDRGHMVECLGQTGFHWKCM